MPADLSVLETSLGRPFTNRELLTRALTHKSLCFDKKPVGEAGSIDNEQLEFLGDSILGFVVSECLIHRYPSYPEGRLSKLKAHLVSAVHLHLVAQAMDLGAFIRHLPPELPLLWVGLGSNLLVRDGGIRGAVVSTHGALGGLERLSATRIR